MSKEIMALVYLFGFEVKISDTDVTGTTLNIDLKQEFLEELSNYSIELSKKVADSLYAVCRQDVESIVKAYKGKRINSELILQMQKDLDNVASLYRYKFRNVVLRIFYIK